MKLSPHPLNAFRVNDVDVRVYPTRPNMGRAAAEDGAEAINEAISRRGRARLIFAASDSQLEMLDALTSNPEVDWSRVTVFQTTEYLSLSPEHPASFRSWLHRNLLDRVRPGQVEFIRGEAPDISAECHRYAGLLLQDPIDVAFLGIGENGHLAFNDPQVADFGDPLTVKVVRLDDTCRLQQVGEARFIDLDSVPTHAYTLTLPALMRGRRIICSVPDARKAEAVRHAIEGPLTGSCPASLLMTHHHTTVYLDMAAASMLTRVPSRILD